MQLNESPTHDHDLDRLIRINEVKKLTTLSKSSINAWVAAGRFPAPKHLSSTVKVWKYREILGWIDDLVGKGN